MNKAGSKIYPTIIGIALGVYITPKPFLAEFRYISLIGSNILFFIGISYLTIGLFMIVSNIGMFNLIKFGYFKFIRMFRIKNDKTEADGFNEYGDFILNQKKYNDISFYIVTAFISLLLAYAAAFLV